MYSYDYNKMHRTMDSKHDAGWSPSTTENPWTKKTSLSNRTVSWFIIQGKPACHPPSSTWTHNSFRGLFKETINVWVASAASRCCRLVGDSNCRLRSASKKTNGEQLVLWLSPAESWHGQFVSSGHSTIWTMSVHGARCAINGSFKSTLKQILLPPDPP